VAKTDAPAATVLEGKTMGTFWRVSVMNLDKTRTDELRGKIQAQLDADDQLLSTYKNDSALMRFNLSTSTSVAGERGDGRYRDRGNARGL
jgi:thiamine biosynthesis lipoprotein